ncbi:MAG: CotH kinase family protein [Planctomycetes bacterium]|nr:CotH kinase family protein [Planctomycetota bacterium]
MMRKTASIFCLDLVLCLVCAVSAPWPMAGALRADEVLDVVISEIMYNPSSGDRREDYIEIHNRSATQTYNLEGWSFTAGVDFTFPDIDLGPGEYLVVCADQTRIQQLYSISATVGDWDPATTLDNGGERIRLVNAQGVEIEDMTYDDRNPWPILADGLGHSLERRVLGFDNDDPANWAASGTGTSWIRVRTSGLATSSRLYLYLTEAGVAYVDDVKIYPTGNPGDNRVPNGGFEDGTEGWTLAGSHSGSSATTSRAHSGARSLEIVATGAGGSSGDSVWREDLGLVIDDGYELEMWVLLPEPGQTLVARLSGSAGAADPIDVETSGGGATPGAENSVLTDNIPPFIYPVMTSPAAPVATDDVTILAIVRDDSEVASVTLYYDHGAGTQTVEMLDDGLHGDEAPGDGLFGRSIGSFPTGTIVRYWATAEDDTGQTGRFPFAGNPTPNLGFYVEPQGIQPAFPLVSNSGLLSDKPAVYHLLIDPAELDANQHLSGDLLRYRRATFIYNGEVFDNIRVRHRGQTSLSRPKKHWKINFNKDHRFLTPFADHPEVDNINIQSSEGDKSFLREWLSYKAFMDIGLPSLEMWHVRLYINGQYRGLYVHLENPNDDWMDRTGLDAEGWLWKSYSQAQSGSTSGFELKADGGNAAAANSALSTFLSSVNSRTGQSLIDYIQQNMDVDAFIDFLALHQLMHNADHPAKNYLVYADEDSPATTWTYLLWDADLTFGRNFECSNCGLGSGVWNDCMRYDMWNDPQLLFATQVKPKCDGPWNGVINAFLYRTTAFRESFYARTAQLLETDFHPDVLLPLIDQLAGPLAAEVALDWQRNPPTYGRRNSPGDYLFHVSEMKTFVVNRYNYLQAALAQLTAPDIDGLECTRSGGQARLAWTNGSSDYDEIRVFRNLQLVQTLPPSAQETSVDLDLGATLNTFRVASVFASSVRPGKSCTIIISSGGYAAVIDEDFSAAVPSSELSINCDAAQLSGRLELTQPVGNETGSAFFRTRVPLEDIIIDFDFRLDDPSSPGADGLLLIFNTGTDPTICGAAGGGMGYFDGVGGRPVMPGYALVFDTWQNSGEVSHNWVGFVDESAATVIREAVDVPEELNGNGTFHAKVLGAAGAFTLFLSNASIGMAEREILTFAVPGFPAGVDALIGFSAGTGGAWARHIVDNVVVQIATGASPPEASFTASPRLGDAPLTVHFSDLSGGEIDTYFWEFGDGGTSAARSPTHIYEDPGTYTVTLTVEGPGGSDSFMRRDYVTARTSTTVVAEFTALPPIGQKPLAVQFTNQSTNATSYLWDFGDGGTSSDVLPSHTYATAGEFTVSLTAVGAGGAQATRVKENYIQVEDDLDADFDASPRSGDPPLAVQFSDHSSGLTIQSWNWSFGDDSGSTERNPAHTYETAGAYTVSLQVFGFLNGSRETKTAFIRVGMPEPIFLRGDSNGDGGTDISDAVNTLNFLFLGSGKVDCPDAADTDDNGHVELTDAVRLLNYLFLSGPPPEPPYPDPGEDPTEDALALCER